MRAKLGLRGRAALWAGKATGMLSRGLRRGGGTTLPGDVSRWIDPSILTRLSAALADGSVVITGTNGKTTTAALLRRILDAEGRATIANESGANLIFGVTAALVNQTSWTGSVPGQSGIFEIDEASLPRLVQEVRPRAIVVTNLFRDQLDRYGELETTAAHIRRALNTPSPTLTNASNARIALSRGSRGPAGPTRGRESAEVGSSSPSLSLPTRGRESADRAPTRGREGGEQPVVVLNADDPMVASLGDGLANVIYAGLDDASLLQPELSHGADAKFCPRCGSPLVFEGVYFGHVGHYHCPTGDFARPPLNVRATSVSIEGMERMHLKVSDGRQDVEVDVPLSGLYNVYNVVMAMATATAMGIPIDRAAAALSTFSPAFGRMERTVIDDRAAVLLLAKNPTGFNEVLRTAIRFGRATSFLIALNDRIADGQDVSWIWDVDFEQLREPARHIVVTGDRALDLRVRLKYADIPPDRIEVEPDWAAALHRAAAATPAGETLFILPTYTAMLELRAVLTRDGALAPYWETRPLHAKP